MAGWPPAGVGDCVLCGGGPPAGVGGCVLCGVAPGGAWGFAFFAGWPLRDFSSLSCGNISAEQGGGYAPPHPAPTLSGKSRQKAAARRLRQKPLNAGFGRGDAQSAYFVRGLGLPWGLELSGVRPDPHPKPAGVFACACYCRFCESRSGFRSFALRARVGPGLGDWPCGRGLGWSYAPGLGVWPCGRGLGWSYAPGFTDTYCGHWALCVQAPPGGGPGVYPWSFQGG